MAYREVSVFEHGWAPSRWSCTPGAFTSLGVGFAATSWAGERRDDHPGLEAAARLLAPRRQNGVGRVATRPTPLVSLCYFPAAATRSREWRAIVLA